MTQVVTQPIDSPAVWVGGELADSADWIHHLTVEEIADIDSALGVAVASGRPLTDLRPEDFPLGVALGPLVDSWHADLDRGRGFALIRGVPVDRYTDEEAELLFWGLGLHLGTPTSQNAAGDLLGHIRDTGADPDDPSVRLYKTRERLGFHSDGADIIALLCLGTAREGGESLLVSAPAVFNEVQRRRPDLVPLLFEQYPFDRNEEDREGEDPYFLFPICRVENGELSTFFIGWYIRDSQRHDSAPRLTPDQRELLDLIDEIAEDPHLHLSMALRRGDIQLAKNSVLLHSRNEFVDHDEPENKRHLLRLWLAATHGFDDASDVLNFGIPEKEGVVADADAD